MEVDVAIVGAGGAGLSLVTQLDRLLSGSRPGRAGAPSVVLVDPVHRRGTDRTWCFWDAGRSDVEPAVSRTWRRAGLVDRAGRERVLDLDPLRYVMVRSADFYDVADAAAGRLGAARIEGAVEEVRDAPPGAGPAGRATVVTGGTTVRARWVFDSRPAPPALPATVPLLQHFRGWTVRFEPPAGSGRPGASEGRGPVDPDVPMLMDFSVPQPPGAVAFGYVLPLDPRRALVEYTLFSRGRLPLPAYDDALRGYLARRWPGLAYAVEEIEDGVIPMTDAVHARRVGRRVFRLGTAGGATRPSTGYTFAAMQRQAAHVAQALIEDRDPAPPPPYPARHRWMDAVLLRALDRGHVEGADLFVRLFDRNPPERVLRFLDGGTGRGEDLALMSTSPTLAMARATAGNLLARAARRGRARAAR